MLTLCEILMKQFKLLNLDGKDSKTIYLAAAKREVGIEKMLRDFSDIQNILHTENESVTGH